jgi:hypothetical protein
MRNRGTSSVIAGLTIPLGPICSQFVQIPIRHLTFPKLGTRRKSRVPPVWNFMQLKLFAKLYNSSIKPKAWLIKKIPTLSP